MFLCVVAEYIIPFIESSISHVLLLPGTPTVYLNVTVYGVADWLLLIDVGAKNSILWMDGNYSFSLDSIVLSSTFWVGSTNV